MLQLQQHDEEIKSLDIRVVVVTFELSTIAEAYVRDNKLPWPLLVDKDRSLYKAYGMHHGKWSKLLGPANVSVYLKLVYRGRKLNMATGDVKQLGGDVLIDPDGIVRLLHVGSGPADRPSIDSLLDIVREQT